MEAIDPIEIAVVLENLRSQARATLLGRTSADRELQKEIDRTSAAGTLSLGARTGHCALGVCFEAAEAPVELFPPPEEE